MLTWQSSRSGKAPLRHETEDLAKSTYSALPTCGRPKHILPTWTNAHTYSHILPNNIVYVWTNDLYCLPSDYSPKLVDNLIESTTNFKKPNKNLNN